MISFMLDTDICSYIIKERPMQVLENFNRVKIEQLCISIVTYAELLYGVELSSSKKVNKAIIDDFVLHLSIVQWDKKAAEHYAKIRSYLQVKGFNIGSMDMMIAAHARSQKMVLVSNNTKHFKRVPELFVENWTEKMP